MEISKSTFNSLLDYIESASVTENYELELLLASNKVTKDGFNRIMSNL